VIQHPFDALRQEARSRSEADFVAALAHPVLVGLYTVPGSLNESPTMRGGTLVYSDNRTLEEKLFGTPKPDINRIRGWMAVVRTRHGNDEYISLGRGEHNDVVVGDESVSTDHARMYRYPASSLLLDVGSSNGTWHNQLRIEAMEEVQIHPGDELQFGRVVCAYLSPAMLRDYLLDDRSPWFN
jgi:hypothetical protein